MNHLNRGSGPRRREGYGGAPRQPCRGSSGPSRRLREPGGQTVVEFALVLPIVAALIVVLLQFGKIIYSYISLTHLANEGARYAAVNKFPGGQTSVSGFLCPKMGTDAASTAKTVNVSFVAAASPPTAGDAVTVKLSENYKLIPYWGGATIGIDARASMRLEQPATFTAENTSC